MNIFKHSEMARISIFLLSFILLFASVETQGQFTLDQITAYPFPSELTASSKGSKIAFAVNRQGIRNIYVAEGPDFSIRKLTNYNADDGQEITGIQISNNGKWVVYVRGGDHGGGGSTIPRNPASSITETSVKIFSIPFEGGEPVELATGDQPVFSSDDEVSFLRNGQVFTIQPDGSGKPALLFYTRGRIADFKWSPNGEAMAFSVARGNHSFAGIFRKSSTFIQWIDPQVARDQNLVWSPDGKQLAFVRKFASGGAVDSLTVRRPDPWTIRIANIDDGSSKEIWASPITLEGSTPSIHGRYNMHWVTKENIVFMSYQDGWPHMYSIGSDGKNFTQLTKGNFMLEHISVSADRTYLLASANTGTEEADIDKRHIVKIDINKGGYKVLTPGAGIETFAVNTGDGKHIAYFSAGVKRPTTLAIMQPDGSKMLLAGASLIPANFPTDQLVVPEHVKFKASDGMQVYGQIFYPAKRTAKMPAIVFIHGGPQRQMLTGWHYGDYYANTYALNQYLASKGFVVLSVNYRLGIGYGYDFHRAPDTYYHGAAEYLDIKAAGEWLANKKEIDKSSIGVYGGSYGGFLTALALGKNSDIFAAGVDIHGVHNFNRRLPDLTGEAAPDAELSASLIKASAPISYIDSWSSPVLFIHGDDDANVNFNETVDLIRRFEQKGKPYESLIIPDETHHWMKYSNMLKVDKATAEFLIRHLMKK